MTSKVYYISGIDTDCGKTFFTAHLAAFLHRQGMKVITQKPIQTGCIGMADDLLEHRRVMGINLLPEDLDGTTCSYLLRMPASPHLASQEENTIIDPDRITAHTQLLKKKYSHILIEGAGGLMVPLTSELLTIDYIKQNNYPLILVSSSKLGSINHTLLSLESCLSRNINIHTLFYNRFANHDQRMADDTLQVIKQYIKNLSPHTKVIEYREPFDLTEWEE